MEFAALIIGDEILSGKRQDKHFAKLLEVLGARGLSLASVRYLADDRIRLSEAFRTSFAEGLPTFVFGGIGVTPDDHTRQAAAVALGVPLVLQPEAEAIIRERFGDATTPERLLLGTFPEGADIVPNPYNQIPGFAIREREHYFFPGFPVMAHPMLEWVLETHYADLFHTRKTVEQALVVEGAHESRLLGFMEQMVVRYPTLKLFSLPSVGEDGRPPHIELGVRGEVEQVEKAMEEIKAEMNRRGFVWQPWVRS